MKPIHTFAIVPRLPQSLEPLRELAFNLRWSWNHDAIELFRRLDSDLWEATKHNPVLMLGSIPQERLDAAAADESFMAHLDRASRDLHEYLSGSSTWFSRKYGSKDVPLIAYFSAEFGITECLSIFAGGLGILAGDHLKSASDLGVPLVGMGLLYQQGYFSQYLNAAGLQQEVYEENDFHNLPIILERKPDGSPLTVEIACGGNKVLAQIWRANVGRVALYLLDANIEANHRAEDRDLTDQLYAGGLDMRIRQEILLGIGGYRALRALNLHPTVCHMNEGHSAFLSLELVRNLMETQKLSFAEARELASAALVFTTHTPVEAGHDYFPPSLIDRYFTEYMTGLGLNRKAFLAWGRRNPDDDQEPFCMTTLALRMAGISNGVSKLHGQVSRRMWKCLWPDVPEPEVPIGHVTNGVHFRSWISNEMNQLYDRYLGPIWHEQPAEQKVWQRVESIPSEELWRTHERRRVRLVAFARQRLRLQLQRRGAPKAEIEAAEEVLDTDALTIGFARRFATYKRATLFLRDRNRLSQILNNPDRPVQIIFAGKAHPKDEAGKELIRQIVALAREPEFRRRLVFIEDYEMSITRSLVQGADVWLNTPLRPNEASGTSGMKAVANGVLNLSTLDGWWDEAWHFHREKDIPIGWAVGRGEIFEGTDYQDHTEAQALYEMLEHDVVPVFYDRSADGLPRQWIRQMKASMSALCHFFNTHRMVEEYTENAYISAYAKHRSLYADGAAQARGLAARLEKIRKEWPNLRIELIGSDLPAEVIFGTQMNYQARVYTAALSPEEITVELCLGRVDASHQLVEIIPVQMNPIQKEKESVYLYEGSAFLNCSSGLHGATARILPNAAQLHSRFVPGLIRWP